VPPEFSLQALERLATPRSILVERAIRDRDRGQLTELADDVRAETGAVYGAMRNYLASLQSDILRAGGRAAHDRAVAMACDHALRPVVRELTRASFAARVTALIGMLRASGSEFTVHEDAAAVTIRAARWGPARPVTPPAAVLSDSSYVTGGYPHLPCTLALEVMLLVVLPVEEWGEPWAVPAFPADWSDPVLLTLYKDPADVPATVYDQIQLARPATAVRGPTGERALSVSDTELAPVRRDVLLRHAAESGEYSPARLAARTLDADLSAYEGPLTLFVTSLLTFVARTFGESEVVAYLERPVRLGMTGTIQRWPGLSPRDRVELLAMFWRAHGSTFWIDEYDDHFLVHGLPLGACHRLWWPRYEPRIRRISPDRIRYPTYGAYTGPAGLALLRESRAVTCGRRNYPIYSARCHLAHEILPIRELGFPLWAERHPVDDPRAETSHLVMKDDSRWPAWVLDRLKERTADG
jgi:hypothetical protein